MEPAPLARRVGVPQEVLLSHMRCTFNTRTATPTAGSGDLLERRNKYNSSRVDKQV